MLEIVDHHEHFQLAQVVKAAHAGRLCDRRGDQRSVLDRSERNEKDTVAELIRQLCSDLQRQPRLAASTCPGDRDQPCPISEELGQLGQLPFATNERCRRDREIRSIERLQRRERGISELINPLRRSQILQPVLAKVAQPISADEIARRLRDQDLTAMTGGRDARRPVDVDAHIPLLGEQRLPVCRPIRTPSRPELRASCASPAAASASFARPNATKNASPCVSTSTPPCRANASRNTRRCSSSTSAYASPNSCSNFVDPSTSVKRNVTVPEGRSRRTGVMIARHRVYVTGDGRWCASPSTDRRTYSMPMARAGSGTVMERSRGDQRQLTAN